VPPAPSGSARKKGTGGEGAPLPSARPHATATMRENTFRAFSAAHADVRDCRRSRAPFQAKSLPIRAIAHDALSSKVAGALRRDQASPYHSPPVPLATASIATHDG
jgi:hypothetical protein